MSLSVVFLLSFSVRPLPVVDSAFMLSRPLVQFNSPADQLATFVMQYREEFARLPAAQQVDRGFVPIDASSSSVAGPKRRQDQPARAVGKRKQLPTAPFSSAAVVQALPTSVPPSDRQGHDAAEQSSEATDYDDGAVRYRAGPQHRSRGGAGAFDDEECEGQDGEGGGWDGEGGGEEGEVGGEEEEGGGEADDGNEGDAEGEDDGMDEERDDVGEEVEDNRSSQFHCRHHNESQGHREDDACHVGDAVNAGGQCAASRGMSQSYDQTKDRRDESGSRGKRKRGEASTSPVSRTKQARADAVNEARGALTTSQEARAPRKTGGGGRSGSRGGGRGGGRKGSQRSRAPKLRDSGDEGEGVGPRMPEDIEELAQHAAPVDTTRCFFLEYDEQGFARQDVQIVNVDVNRIKPIPRGKILLNHRSLSENIVRGIESAIGSSISADPGVWDRPDLVFAPVDPNIIVGGQGRRIRPDEFFQRDSAEFDRYAVCGQHTAEAMKRLVGKDSPTVKVYGLRTYSKVRVVFFDDDHTHGYFNVSLFDNTRENRAMMLSFQDVVRDMRQWWIDNNRIEAPKAKVSEKDVVAVAHQKTWQNFLRACMGKAWDKAFVKQALDNEYNKDWSNKLRGYLNLTTSTRTVWPLVEKFFAMFEEGKLPIGDDKIPLEMPGRMEGRLPGPYTDENKGQRTLYHYIYARDGPKGSTVSWKDLCPTYFKNFGDMTCREREVALLLLMSGKVVGTKVRVTPPRVNTECLLDIMRKERYMVRMFNYVVFHAEGKEGDEWNDDFFMSYKDLEESDILRQLYRWENIELIPGSWKRVDRPPSDVTRYGNIATSSRDLIAIVLHAEGGDLKKVTVAPRLHNDLTEVHVEEEKFGKCLGKHGGVEGDESAAYSIWEREPGKLRKLCGSFVGEAEGVLLLGRAHAGLVWKLLLADNNVIACDKSAKDIAYLTKFVDLLIKDGRFECRLEKPSATHRTNSDMYHKLGPKRLKVWEYLFRDAPDGRLDGGYIYRKAKVTEALKHYHGALTGAFETFVARCEILRFDLHKGKLTFKDNADLAKSGEGFNPVDSEEDTSDSDLEIEKDTNATGWCGKSAAMEHSVKGYGPGQSEGCSNLPPANSVASGVDRVVCTPVEDDEDDDLDIPAQPTKLAQGDPIPPRFCADANNHDGIFEPCIQGGEWKMAVKYVSKGWRPFPRMGKDNRLKMTEQSILYRYRKENPGESETSIAAKAKQLFDALGATRQLEYSHKFYELQSSPSYGKIDWKVERTAALESMDVDSREDAAPVPEVATGNTMGEQREDGGMTFGVKPPLPEVGNTPAGKITIGHLCRNGGYITRKKGEGEGAKEAFVPVKDDDQREAIRRCGIFKYLTKGQTLESCKGNFKMKCPFCDKAPFEGSQARGAEHFTKGRCPKVTPEVLVDIWNTTQYPSDQRRERQVRDYMEYHGIRNNREVGVGVGEDDEVQDVLDREAADNEGGRCGGEDDEMDTGAEGEGEGPMEDGGEDDVQELGASLQGGSLKARRTAHHTRTRAPMDGRGKRRADTALAARVPDPKRLKQVRLDEIYDLEWQTTFDHLFLQWWHIGGVPFERARMPEYRALTRHLQNMPRGMKPTLPQFKRIAGSGIQEERAHIADKLRDIREQMQHTGATILTDGRKSLNSEPIVNFLAAGQSGAFFSRRDQQKKVAEMTLEYIYTQTGLDRQGDMYRLVRQQLYDFHAYGPRYDWGGDAGTGDEDTCEGLDETQVIADWWVLHGSCALELCVIATRLMYTWVCASPAERNWALHERIHEKRHNGLDFTKLTEMVEICTNKKLLACRQRRRGLVLPWGDLEEGLDDVPEPRRSAHIELYHEEIEYDPPTDPHAADEMEAEPWTDPEDLEQRGSDTPDVGDESNRESDHEAANDMRSWDRQNHCDVDRMTPPLTRGAADRGRKQTQVVRSSSKDDGGDRSDDGDAAYDEDSDVEREGPDQDRGHGDEHGFDDGDGSGPIEDGAGGAFLVTPRPSAAGGGGSGGHGFGLEVPQGSIPSGIFSDGFDLGRPPTSDAHRGGVRVQTPVSEVAHLIGSVFCGVSSGLLTEAARASSEIQEGRTGDDGGRVARRLHMEPEDVLEEESLARMVSGCATTQRLALEQDTTRTREMGCSVEEVTAARLAAECRHDGPADVADGGGLCTEGHVVARADDHQEDARVGLGGLCGASDTVLPTTDEADGGDSAATTDAEGLLGCDGTEVEGQVDRALVAVVVAAMEDVVADHTQDGLVAVDAMVAHRNEEERQVDPGDVVAHPVEAHEQAYIEEALEGYASIFFRAPSGVSGDIGKTMEMVDLFEQLTGQRVIEPGGVSWGAGPAAAGTGPACAWAVSGRGGESGGSVVGGGGGPAVVGGRSGLSGGSVGWGEGSAAPTTAGGRMQVQGSPSPSSKPKGKSVSWSGISMVTRKLKDAMPGVTGERRDHEGRLTEMFADAEGWVRKGDRLKHVGAGSSCAADRRGSTMVAPPILDEESRRQTGTRPGSRRAVGGHTEDSAMDGVPMPRGRKTYTTLTGVLGRSGGGGVEREVEVQEAERVAARAVASHAVSVSQHPGEGEEMTAKVPQRRRERIIDDDDTDDGQCDAP
ncbi:hypothetical protein CBR_g8021 [Chara braunii]|uniref:Integrase catalytic domain-containing protein n=1 Tax=Chara braunii TaxID=69332 RepID=A0A388KL00_CHABU|nr:hypothetical protein CBR_g8021 [Chara braunii]|eukprot:GBG70722.1 hypothetical protein CBR_g8021 [Chara braunii]